MIETLDERKRTDQQNSIVWAWDFNLLIEVWSEFGILWSFKKMKSFRPFFFLSLSVSWWNQLSVDSKSFSSTMQSQNPGFKLNTKRKKLFFGTVKKSFFPACRWPDSNRHGCPLDFESSASANSATAARLWVITFFNMLEYNSIGDWKKQLFFHGNMNERNNTKKNVKNVCFYYTFHKNNFFGEKRWRFTKKSIK